jgi:hypothetical protein
MRILFALPSVGVGVALLAIGFRMARLLIPLMGFLAGLTFGGAIIANSADAPFLGTLAGIVVGLITGVFLAVLAYAYYYIAVIVLAIGIGFWLGSGFILLFGVNPGFLSTVVGIALGAVAGITAALYDAPKYLLIVLTSIAGAVTAVGGVMLLFNVIPLDIYSYNVASFTIRNSFFWSVLGLVALGVGVFVQSRSSAASPYIFHKWGMDDGSVGHGLPPAPTTHVSGVR